MVPASEQPASVALASHLVEGFDADPEPDNPDRPIRPPVSRAKDYLLEGMKEEVLEGVAVFKRLHLETGANLEDLHVESFIFLLGDTKKTTSRIEMNYNAKNKSSFESDCCVDSFL